jgi:hypothetical protein
MINMNSQIRAIILGLLVCLGTGLLFSSCASNESKAKKVIQEYLKGQGVTELTLDSFVTSPNNPGKHTLVRQ